MQLAHGVILLIAPAASSLGAQSAGFPPRALPAGTIAAGDAATAPNGLDAIFLNAARVVTASGFAATYLAHDETGLRGYALSAGFELGVPVALSVWKYEVAGLFDDDLLAADPGLASLGVFTTGLDLVTGARIGLLDVGIGSSLEFQHTLAVEHRRASARVGVATDRRGWMAGLAFGTLPEGSLLSGPAVGRGTLVVKPLRATILVEVGLEATWTSTGNRSTFTNSALVGTGALRLLAGWRWADRQPTAGILLNVERFSLGVAREFGGRETIGGLTVLTFAHAW
jgi:hypothetical protein